MTAPAPEDATSSPDRPYWTPLRVALWGLAAALVGVWAGPRFVAAFRPPDAALLDFTQEWLSAKNYRAGTPVYADQAETYPRHTGRPPNPPEALLRWNAHPPASVVLALPFGGLSYADAHAAWNLATFPLFVLSVVLILRELRVPLRPASVFPLLALGLSCHPLVTQHLQGQLNAVLALLIVLAWVAERRGYAGWAGAAVGAAAAVKLFPAFLFLYFVAAGRWRALLPGAAAFLALNGVALALFGPEAFRTYARDVVPSVAADYQTNWRNVSLWGFWLRIFDPQEKGRLAALVHAPLAGRAVANVLRVVVTLLAARACWRARGGERTDRAFAVTLTAMLLVSPISWNHYYLLLALPVAVVWWRLPPGLARRAMWPVLAVLWLPDHLAPLLALGGARAIAMARDARWALTPAENLYTASVPHYALCALFVLALLLPARSPGPDEPGGG